MVLLEHIETPSILKHEVNAHSRQFYIDKVNRPLAKAITILASRYPEPTMDNLLHPNSKRLLEMRNDYLLHDTNDHRKAIVQAVFRVVICKYEHSPNYRDVMDYLVLLLFGSGWKQLNPSRQMSQWRKDGN